MDTEDKNPADGLESWFTTEPNRYVKQEYLHCPLIKHG